MNGKSRGSVVLLLAIAFFAFHFLSPDVQPLSTAPDRAEFEIDHDANRPTPPARTKFEIDHDANRVFRRDANGKERWSTTLKGYLGIVRPPHLLADAERVYVSHEDGVTALDAETGKVLWQSKGPNDRLLLSDGLLLAADCTSDTGVGPEGRWLTARETKTGAEAFRTRLPVEDFDPRGIADVAGLFVVLGGEAPSGKGLTLLIDRHGKIRHRLGRQLVDARLRGKDLLLLTSRDLVAVAPGEQMRWTIPFRHREWIAGGGLTELPGGDLLAFLFGCISDSGVQLIRLDPAAGKVLWQARCDPLGVMHSEYYHAVDAKVERGCVKVTSKGSSGTFVELLDLRSGRQIRRTRFGPEVERPGE